MSSLLGSFNQYWQESSVARQKLVAAKYKRQAVVLNYRKRTEREITFDLPESFELIEERACILASDIGLPFDWAEAVIKLRNMTKPSNISVNYWRNIQDASNILYANNFTWLKTIIAHSWSLHDIYGCSFNKPCTSFTDMGLLLSKNQQEKIVSVDENSIKLQKKSGSIVSFYKPLFSSSRVLLHELI